MEKLINVLIALFKSEPIAIYHESLTLTGTAQPFPFTTLKAVDVKAIEIRIRKAGTPADSTHLARLSMTTQTPTTSLGMFLGDGDLYTITGNENCRAAQIISADGGSHVCNIIYYG